MQAADRNVFVLGAGFSWAAGVPLVPEFLDFAKRIYHRGDGALSNEAHKRMGGALDFKKTIVGLRERIRMDLDNVETLLGLADMSRQLGDITIETWNDCTYLIAKTIELATLEGSGKRPDVSFFAKSTASNALINDLLNRKVIRASPGFTPPRFSSDVYHFFALLVSGRLNSEHLVRRSSDTIISFNYDLVLDDALLAVGAVPDYHLPNDVISGAVPGSTTGVPLLKLHGSVNWGICGNCRKRIILFPAAIARFSAEERNMACPGCHSKDIRTLLVPPTWDKSEYRTVMSPIWTKAAWEIRNATRICVIGYSVPETDIFFKYLLALGLAQNDRLEKFIVVDLEQDGPPTGPWGIHRQQTVREKYEQLLDEDFRKRKLLFFGDGFEKFFCDNRTLFELNRGDLVDRVTR